MIFSCATGLSGIPSSSESIFVILTFLVSTYPSCSTNALDKLNVTGSTSFVVLEGLDNIVTSLLISNILIVSLIALPVFVSIFL